MNTSFKNGEFEHTNSAINTTYAVFNLI